MALVGIKNTAEAIIRRVRRTPPHDVLNRELIARHASGRSFADVGAMWKVHGGYSFHAVVSGATSVVAVDLMPASAEFDAANAAHGGRVRLVTGDINDPAVCEAVGPVDVVFCSGVLYHVPDPLLTLGRLKRLTRSVLILASATIPEQSQPQVAVFLPFLDDSSRRAVAYRTRYAKLGLDSPYAPEAGYANWFWGFTPSCVAAMLRAADLDVLETYRYRHAVTMVCRPR